MPRSFIVSAVVAGLFLCGQTVTAEVPASLDDALKVIQDIGPKGKGNAEAIQAMSVLSKTPASLLPNVLSKMSADNPIANNWIRAAVESIVDRDQQAGGHLPTQALIGFINDTSHSVRARELAFQIVSKIEPSKRANLIDGMLNDPSIELRRLAVEKVLGAINETEKEASIAGFRKTLEFARDKDQIKTISEKLKELGQEVDLSRHFGFVMRWQLIAPFDNTNTSGFDKTYPPENSIDLAASYVGKGGAKVKWVRHVTEDPYGMVDLNKTLEKHKGSVAYAVSEFQSSSSRDAELRLGCINANKIWLNGELLTANHVYHSGRGIDQYSTKCKLKKGSNTILLKICQNEQTETGPKIGNFSSAFAIRSVPRSFLQIGWLLLRTSDFAILRMSGRAKLSCRKVRSASMPN